MIRAGIVLLVMAHVCGVVVAQTTTLSFNHLTSNEGLTDGKVRTIGQDHQGYIWMGTGYGLNRFNGYEIDHFMSRKDDTTSISNPQVYGMLTTSTGNIYFNARGIPNKFRFEDGTFQRYCFGHGLRVGAMCEAEPGHLWMFTPEGLARYDESCGELTLLRDHPDSLVRALAVLPVQDLVYDRKGHLYLATTEGLLEYTIAGGAVRRFMHHDEDPGSLPSDDIRHVVVDHAGIIWMSTDYYGSSLCRLDPVSGRVRTYEDFHSDRNDWADNRIIDLMIDSRNRLWVASLRAGIAKYNPTEDDFIFFLHDPMRPSSVSANSAFCLYEDRDGIIWAGTEGYGVDYFQPDRNYFTVIGPSAYRSPTLPDKWCRSVAMDDAGHYWIGTYKGLSRWDPGTGEFRNFLLARAEYSESNNSVRSVLVDLDGTIWIGTGGGLNRMDPRTEQIHPIAERDALASHFISFIFKDREGRMWVCTPDGMYLFHRDAQKFENVFATPELSKYRDVNVVNAFEDSRGHLWLSVAHLGLLQYIPGDTTVETYPFETLNPLSPDFDYITSIAEDHTGLIWASSFDGVIALDPVENTTRIYRQEDGLASNKTSGLLVDSLDRLWVATSNGLCMIDTDRKRINCFDMHDGLPTNYFYEGNAYQLSNGLFAYPTFAGVVLFDPETIHPEKQEVSVMISALAVSGDSMTFHAEALTGQPVHLRYNENFFAIELTGLHYANPGNVRYAYQLDGFDPEWHYTKERHINYTNVPGGDYMFRYKASLNGVAGTQHEQVLPIHIDTVYYATWWFRLTVIAVFLAGLIGFFRWRLGQQQTIHHLESKAQQLEKDKALVLYESLKQQLNPHFLFNSLTSLRGMIRVDQKMAGEFLDMMSSIYRYILRNREHELVSLREEIGFAQTYIDLQKTRFQEGLVVRIQVDEEYMHRKIAPVTLQNLIENAIKHNRIDTDSPLVITIVAEQDYLVVRNNLQRKDFVETSNKQGLMHLVSLYRFFDIRKVEITEKDQSFSVRIPLI